MAPPPPPLRRRMLALPAVCPCEAIAPAPLLASLLSLAADVAGLRAADLDALPALRGAARETVRIAGLLLAFLDGIPVPDEVEAAPVLVLGLSELHVALQKLRLLLADCARKGARLWVLMNAELAASELRVLLGSVATAMDVLLPLLTWHGHVVAGASADAEEIAGLVSRHARRAAAQLRPDPDDDRVARCVRSVLARFASGITPDAEDARLVLDRVGLTTWSDCAEETAFLEAELLERLETGSDDDNDLVLIAGLMAFLLYCRVVLFDRIDDSSSKADKATTAANSRLPPRCAVGVSGLSPEALQCPITLELMMDPVTVATGQTYDRASIKKWIKNGCWTCPVTGERLRSADFVPNVAVRGVIEQLLSRGVPVHEPSGKHRCAVDKTATPFGAAAAGGVRLSAAFLTARLSSSSGAGAPEAEQRKATHEAVRKINHAVCVHGVCVCRVLLVHECVLVFASSVKSIVCATSTGLQGVYVLPDLVRV